MVIFCCLLLFLYAYCKDLFKVGRGTRVKPEAPKNLEPPISKILKTLQCLLCREVSNEVVLPK